MLCKVSNGWGLAESGGLEGTGTIAEEVGKLLVGSCCAEETSCNEDWLADNTSPATMGFEVVTFPGLTNPLGSLAAVKENVENGSWGFGATDEMGVLAPLSKTCVIGPVEAEPVFAPNQSLFEFGRPGLTMPLEIFGIPAA